MSEHTVRLADDYMKAVFNGEALLVADGAMGTMLIKAGLDVVKTPADLLNLSNPDQVTDIHRQYVEAGADFVTTNTFGANSATLGDAATANEVFEAAASAARAAGARYVAGDIGPLRSLMVPNGPVTFQQAYELFAEQVRAADAAGCDLLILETFTELAAAKAAVLAAKENSDLPIVVTMSFNESGRTFLGTTPAIFASTMSALGVQMLGANCSVGPEQMAAITAELLEHSTVPVLVQPNAGQPRFEDEVAHYDVTAEEFAVGAKALLEMGIGGLGSCCGSDPSFTAAIRTLVDAAGAPAPRNGETAPLLLTAPTKTVAVDEVELSLDDDEVLDFCSDAGLIEALEQRNAEDLAEAALDIQAEGADVIGIRCPAGADMAFAVLSVQAAASVPMVLMCDEVDTLADAARVCAGTPLLVSTADPDKVAQIARIFGAVVR